MKKIIVLFCIISVFAVFIFPEDIGEINNQRETIVKSNEMSLKVGFSLPTVGWVSQNSKGEVTGYTGFNLGLGFSARKYFEPLRTNEWNGHWDFGTVYFLIPYLGVGAEYLTDSGFYFGLGVIYLIPYIEFGVNF
ncbi:MAG: hypothetical protein H7A30_07560 [Thermotogae bacterium]|nr:hypothetical protein [Thermotogota bacterium]